MSSPHDRVHDLTRPTIPVRYLLDVLDRTKPAAAVRARAIDAAGMSARALRSPRMRLSIAQWERIHEVLIEANDDELFGWFARPVPAGAFATLVRSLTGCAAVAACCE